ncbi:MAG TPA: serine/threonine-protein kinase [Kofleriaceae bacterium]|nr:serine/threonine-protein kinase [Kofleriaceae bacterium]
MASDETDALTEIDHASEPRVDLEQTSVIDLRQERYERLGKIGRGGMGEVVLCKDTRIVRQVAMKQLRSKYKNDPAHRERFLFEARVQGQLEHPAIVPVHDLGETDDGELFFTMKRIRGVTLAKAMDQVRDGVGTYTRRRLLTAFSSICLAVDFAHTRGVVHRDLKPQNIMLGDFGEVYIIDWGIAKLIGHEETPISELVDFPGSDSSSTQAGAVLGTPLYMAPERREGIATPGTDVYSLGVILGQILETEDDIAPELGSISRRASEQDPTYRFKSARELHDAIERFLDGDRDLEARRKLAQDHVARAEAALASRSADARTAAARDVGRALGLDPSNAAALRILMRLMSDMPAELPPAAQQEIDRRWFERRARTMRIGSLSTLSVLLMTPFILASGVLNWTYFAAYVGCVCGASALQWNASRTPNHFYFASAFCLQIIACSTLTWSLGLVGLVPATFTLATVAWRQNVRGLGAALLMLAFVLACLIAPIALASWGITAPFFAVRNHALVILPVMHDFSPITTTIYATFATFGVIAASSIYGRLFVSEIRQAEAKLTFQAWQLQQLLPPV